jgi:hypothetical protein
VTHVTSFSVIAIRARTWVFNPKQRHIRHPTRKSGLFGVPFKNQSESVFLSWASPLKRALRNTLTRPDTDCLSVDLSGQSARFYLLYMTSRRIVSAHCPHQEA